MKKFIKLVSFLILFTIAIFISIKCQKENNKSDLKQSSKVENENFIEGMKYLSDKNYKIAIDYFEKIDSTDSNYSDAQNHIKNLKEYLKEVEPKIKEYKSKYEKLMHSGLYQYEILERLKRDGFQLIESKYEKAPDGSNNIKQYFRKNINNVTIDIDLQDSYSLSSYYMNVKVY